VALLAFELTCGARISFSEILLRETYSCLLEGTPNARVNKVILDGIPGTVAQVFGDRPHLVVPPEIAPGLQEHEVRLPRVLCFADATSLQPVHDPDMDGSELVLVWFQDHPAPPISPAVLPRLTALKWAQFARDFRI
jgi:hypothetical protein